MASSCPGWFGIAVHHAGVQHGGLLAANVEHNNCCRQQQYSLEACEALQGGRSRETVKCPERPNRAQYRAHIPAGHNAETAAARRATS
jgi:hypothetical protein